ncbi:MAG: glutamine synthetase [Bacteroidetes bacterium GWF2_42_66]|nr:MAG: glutamine synthetase [Bacteroidetes bacterium GWA2_42_15]OFX97974.1 MAG: glutamine synthetase [Bacteroidetes bacterium GWE2_42_39]OFY45789.1 MAG: glutamine synthetase [Bacteroidetes bacterium GWF2_42_66]HBL74711.1 glutamine synthetase type III [Prolixibacteraceae bacterium]HCR89412.1 glutamine synthetase type III [Prolixibacteraceae bacterium]
MAEFRFNALKEVLSRKPQEVKREDILTSDFFGVSVFDRPKMKKYLSKEAYKAVVDAVDSGTTIDRKMADQVAQGMKSWAVENRATHYTHWFHPLTDGTAEKHDAFIVHGENGGVVESFSGSVLAQQEPDASSFPSGGIRQTFEARGYTAWDPSSPAFVVDGTLTIPTIFVSYTGEALDYKTPLLRSLRAIDEAATVVCQYFDKNVTKVYANLGWEQEYFLIDEALFMARPDLMLTGRTLMGHASAKDQQLDDHYFSSIPTRVYRYMEDLENEGYKLGIPLKTRHNEVAPNQFELAPIYEEANLANDHNQLIMDVMKKVARRHNFRVLFHEKPFAGINGSGKHNNWSLATDTGVNLLSPGKNPKSNLQFLTFLINIIKAVYDHQDLLRASIISASNSHRLGANEAPPSIISVFLGTEVSKMLDLMEESVVDRKMTPDEKTALKLNIGRIPEILLDNTDRNRTSPFAFTGNRFEFRAVGSSANCSSGLIALNSAVAAQLKKFSAKVDTLIEKNVRKDEAIFQVLKKLIIDCKPIRFDGNGYSEDWVVEAESRGLTNILSVPKALEAFMSPEVKELFKFVEVYDEIELEGRAEVEYEKYFKNIQIEARVLGDLAINHIVPTAVRYQTMLLENVRNLKEVFSEAEYNQLAAGRKELIKEIGGHVSSIKALVKEMVEARKVANKIEDSIDKAEAYDVSVRPFLEEIRYHIDRLELTVDNELWPLPKYRELLFVR